MYCLELFILGKKSFEITVDSPDEAFVVNNAITDFVEYAMENGIISKDFEYYSHLSEYDESIGEWVTWYDENGCDFHEHF